MDEAARVVEIIRRNSEGQDGGIGGSNIYSDGYRQDFDNDSSTDEEDGFDDEYSSDDDQDFTSKFGKISTQTSRRGKVRIKATEEENVEDESEDDFEADMEKELEGRVLEAEKNAAIARTCLPPPDGLEDDDDMETATSKVDSDAVKDGKYSDIYFDSDEEDTANESRKVVTNDDLFYDPDKDDDDQDWVDSVRQSYHQPGQGVAAPAKLPNSDAVLNCPACFTVLCLDCQRHEVYNTQYRAMFVVNCTVNTEQKLKFPVKGKGKRGKGGKVVTDPNSDYHPVMCDNCKTEVAMYDQDEVYHFFNVVASHS